MRASRVWFCAFTALAVLGAPAVANEVSGIVLDQTGLTPVPGALVSLQATELRTVSGPDGSFSLPIPTGEALVVVAAKKSYYNNSAYVNSPASGVEILLEPVPQGDNPNYEFVQPDTCGICHPDQVNQWNGSPMADAGPNTWVHDIYSGLGTAGGMGGFVYLRDSVFADDNPNSECASCHQPEVWIKTPGSAMEDPTLPPTPEVLHGISCETCHKVADVDVENINYPGLFAGAATFTRPDDDFSEQVMYGVLGDVDFNAPGFMRPSYQPQLVAEVCGLCHQDKNDPDEDHSFSGITSEPTYIEWIESPYGDPNSPHYATCVDCHMPATDTPFFCDTFPILRDPETIRNHDIRGTTPEFLENAAVLDLQTQLVGNEIQVDVNVTNSLTGHHVPTGVTVRNMILLVEAWRDGDNPTTQPLSHTGTQVIHDLGGVGNPAQGYYAGLPGKFYAKVNHDATGNGPTFFTDATGIQFDNRIPALQSDPTSYTFSLPATQSLVHIRARLIYRRAFRFLVDAKQWDEDGHGNPLADVAAPHYGHLMASAESSLMVDPGGGNGMCGDGILDPGEQCDDGNTIPGDGCDENCEIEGQAVPTLSEWGMILLTLLLLTAGTLVIAGRQRRLVAAATGRQLNAFGFDPPQFQARLFVGTLALTLTAAIVGLAAVWWTLGELSRIDIAGTLLCVPVLAYLGHLWLVLFQESGD